MFLPVLNAALKIEAISKPATDLLRVLLAAVPNLIAAGLILFIPYLVASFASRLLASLLSALGFDSLPQPVGLAHAFEKTPAAWRSIFYAFGWRTLFLRRATGAAAPTEKSKSPTPTSFYTKGTALTGRVTFRTSRGRRKKMA